MSWRLALVLLACLAVVGCTSPGYQPPPGDRSGPVHGDVGGGNGGM
jgi:hypothetical protein